MTAVTDSGLKDDTIADYHSQAHCTFQVDHQCFNILLLITSANGAHLTLIMQKKGVGVGGELCTED
jgi:hypothetical protein